MIASSTSEKSGFEFDSSSKEKELQVHVDEIKKRFKEALEKDQSIIQNPEFNKPFSSNENAIERLLPYHIFHVHESKLKNATREPTIQETISEPSDFQEKLACIEKRLSDFLKNETKSDRRDSSKLLSQYILNNGNLPTMSLLRSLSESCSSSPLNTEPVRKQVKSTAPIPPKPSSPVLAPPPSSPLPQSSSSPSSHPFPSANTQHLHHSPYPISSQSAVPIQPYAIPYFPCYAMPSYSPHVPMYYPSAPLNPDPSTGYPMMIYYVAPMPFPVQSSNPITPSILIRDPGPAIGSNQLPNLPSENL